MSTPKLLTLAALSALCLVAALPHARAADDQAAPAAQAVQPAQAGRHGATVVRDAVSGQLRAPTPEELKALRATTPPRAGLQAARPSESMALARRADGARGVRLGESTLVYEVVTRGADGKLSSQCVQGDAAAADAVASPNAASAPARSAGHADHADHADHEEHAHETR